MDLFQLGWTGDNGDPDNFLAVLFDGMASSAIRTQWQNQAYHDLMVQGRQTTDQAKRAELYREAQRLLHDDPPWIFIDHEVQTAAFAKRVQGFKLHPSFDLRVETISLK